MAEKEKTFLNISMASGKDVISPVDVINILSPYQEEGSNLPTTQKYVPPLQKQRELLNRGFFSKVLNHSINSLFLRFVGEVPDAEIAEKIGGLFYKDIGKSIPGLSYLDDLYKTFISPYGLSFAGLVEAAPTILSYLLTEGVGRFGVGLGASALSRALPKKVVSSIPPVIKNLAEETLSQAITFSAIGSGIKYQELKNRGIEDVSRKELFVEELKNPINYALGVGATGLHLYLTARGLTRAVPETMLGVGTSKRLSLLRESFEKAGLMKPEASIPTQLLFGREVSTSEFLQNYIKTGNFIYSANSNLDRAVLSAVPSKIEKVYQIPVIQTFIDYTKRLGADNVEYYLEAIDKFLPQGAKRFFSDEIPKISELISKLKSEKLPSLLKEAVYSNGGTSFLKEAISRLPQDVIDRIPKIENKNILEFLDDLDVKLNETIKNSEEIISNVFANSKSFSKIFGNSVNFDEIKALAIDEINKRIERAKLYETMTKEERDAILKTLEGQKEKILKEGIVPYEYVPLFARETILGTITENPQLLGEIIKDPRFSSIITERVSLIREFFDGLNKVAETISMSGITDNVWSGVIRELQKSRSLVLADEVIKPQNKLEESFSKRGLAKELSETIKENDAVDNLVKSSVGSVAEGKVKLSKEEENLVKEGAYLIEKLRGFGFSDDDIGRIKNNFLVGDTNHIAKAVKDLTFVVEPFDIDKLISSISDEKIKREFIKLRVGGLSSIGKPERSEMIIYSIASIPTENMTNPAVITSAALRTILRESEFNKLRKDLIDFYFNQSNPSFLEKRKEIEGIVFNEVKKHFTLFKNKEYSEENYAKLMDVLYDEAAKRKQFISAVYSRGISEGDAELIKKEAVQEIINQEAEIKTSISGIKTSLGHFVNLFKKANSEAVSKDDILSKISSLISRTKEMEITEDSINEFGNELSKVIYDIAEKSLKEINDENLELVDDAVIKMITSSKIIDRIKKSNPDTPEKIYSILQDEFNRAYKIVKNNLKRELITKKKTNVSLEKEITGTEGLTYQDIIGTEETSPTSILEKEAKEQTESQIVSLVNEIMNSTELSNTEKNIMKTFLDTGGDYEKTIKILAKSRTGIDTTEKLLSVLSAIGKKLPHLREKFISIIKK